MKVMFIVLIVIYFIGTMLDPSEGIVTKQELKDLSLKVVKEKLAGHGALMQEAEALINSPPSNETEFRELSNLLSGKMNFVVHTQDGLFISGVMLLFNPSFNRTELEDSIIYYMKIFLKPELDKWGSFFNQYFELLTFDFPSRDMMEGSLERVAKSVGRIALHNVGHPIVDQLNAVSKRVVEISFPEKPDVDTSTPPTQPPPTKPPPIILFTFKPTDVAKNLLEACRKYSGDSQANVMHSDDRNEYCSALNCKQTDETIRRATNPTPDGAICGPLKKCKNGIASYKVTLEQFVNVFVDGASLLFTSDLRKNPINHKS